MAYFNKIIRLTFKGKLDTFMVSTPQYGFKPDITISGELSANSLVSQFEIRVTNLYTSKPLKNYEQVIVEAGYAGAVSAVIVGTIGAIYSAKPGPDKETVIICNTANLTDWLETTVNLKLPEGTPLATVAQQISSALKYQPPYIGTSLTAKTLPAPLNLNGTAREAINSLKAMFREMNVVINSNRLNLITEEKTDIAPTHNLSILTQAPQYSGESVNICAPWIPNLKPGDLVRFPNKFYGVSLGFLDQALYDTMKVATIQFTFGTIHGNEMSVTGVAL